MIDVTEYGRMFLAEQGAIRLISALWLVIQCVCERQVLKIMLIVIEYNSMCSEYVSYLLKITEIFVLVCVCSFFSFWVFSQALRTDFGRHLEVVMLWPFLVQHDVLHILVAVQRKKCWVLFLISCNAFTYSGGYLNQHLCSFQQTKNDSHVLCSTSQRASL